MKNRHTITNFQLFTLVFFLNTASVLVFGLHKELTQDGWLGVGVSLILISLVFVIYWFLIKNNNQGLSEIIVNSVGEKIGKILIIIYSAYFIYIAYRVFEDLYYLMHLTLLTNTPKWAIYIPLLVVLVYSVNAGVEALGRTSVLLFIMIISAIVLITVIGLLSFDNYQNLFPVLEDGWKPIIKWSSTQFTVLFGEVIAILVYFSNVQDTKKSGKVVYYTLVFNAIFMMFIITLSHLLVDPVITQRTLYPITLTGQMLQLKFLDKVDTLVYYEILYVSFMKILILYYASSSLAQSAFKKVNKIYLNIFLGILIFMLAMFNKASILEHYKIGLDLIPIYLHIPLQVGIPVILLILSLFRKRNTKKESINNDSVIIQS